MIEIFSVYIPAFEEERKIRIYLPNDYNLVERRYPVIYMHDGQNVFRDNDAIGGVSLELETYLNEKKLNVIVVGIDQNKEERKNEYCPWVNGEYSKKLRGEIEPFGGKGKQYINFIINELKPLIDDKYRTLIDHSSMAGISLGGLITTYACCRYPKVFKNIVIMSSAFYANQENIEELLRNTDLSEINSFYLDCGTNEAGEGTIISKEFVNSNKSVYDILKEKIPTINFNIIDGGEHNYLHFRNRIPELFNHLIN
ncbi:alpha/beta hydrolase-fold protein [Bacillus sp. SM2101]|uniref:alpha/beta hydrolase n=1 Tax=Bacillus sp. SM2101 TaxID=2805366 RepID=UPI001BDF1866|nr:alpha/beta hydrolase-fold protein [Bacillus sp. SM2101]